MRINRIYSVLSEAFGSQYLEVLNESHLHAVPAGSETHIKVVLTSDKFMGRARVQRQQDVMGLLKSEFSSGLHALSMQLMTPQEWMDLKGEVTASPECSKK